VLTVDDIQAFLRCGRSKAYAITRRAGRVPNIGTLVRVRKANFLKLIGGETTNEPTATNARSR